jgi:outer membrane protein/protease secretion system outer membrane protein
MRARGEVSQFDVEKARAGHKPTLDLLLQHSLNENDNVTNPNARYINNQVGVQFALPIYGGGYVSAQVRQARASKLEADLLYEAARRKLGAQVRKEFQGMVEGISKIQALEQAERSANQAVISNEKGVLAGARSRLDILNAEQQRSNIRLQLAHERLNYVMARLRLAGLGGKLNQDEIAAVNQWLGV